MVQVVVLVGVHSVVAKKATVLSLAQRSTVHRRTSIYSSGGGAADADAGRDADHGVSHWERSTVTVLSGLSLARLHAGTSHQHLLFRGRSNLVVVIVIV